MTMRSRSAILIGAFFLWALLGQTALAGKEIHGADSSFRAEGITILWAILKGPAEESSFVHIRILQADPGSFRFLVYRPCYQLPRPQRLCA